MSGTITIVGFLTKEVIDFHLIEQLVQPAFVDARGESTLYRYYLHMLAGGLCRGYQPSAERFVHHLLEWLAESMRNLRESVSNIIVKR